MDYNKYKNTVPYVGDGKAHMVEEGRLAALFWADLAEEHGVTGHPKLGVLQGIAYDEGHPAGFSEMAYYFEKMLPLITD
jgi:hypothetical protein